MTEPTNVQRSLESEIAQSRERIIRYTAQLAKLSEDAAQAAARDAMSRALELERARKLDMEQRLDRHLGRRPPRRGLGVIRWLRIALGLAGLVTALVLQYQNRR